MKKLLTITMILGAIMTLEAIQPAEATLTSPVISSTDHSQVTPTWGYHWSFHRHWWRRF